MRRSPALLALALALPFPAHAISIDVEVEDCGFPHPADPNSTQLLAIAEAAAAMWERVAPEDDTTSWHLVYCWDDLGPGTGSVTLGKTWPDPWANASFNFQVDFFMDPTPFDNSEFDMQQKLVQDLTAAELADSFEDDMPPDWMEVGFLGNATTSAAQNRFDLLTIVLHEMGHSVGINYVWGEDYDIYPQFLSGHDNTDVMAELDHLVDPYSVMVAQATISQRRLISATDVFALADDEDYDEVFLDRVDLLGANPGDPQAWEMPLSWEGGQVPDATTSVNVRAPAVLFGTGRARDLTIHEGGEVDLFPGDLVVQDAITIAEEPDGVIMGRGSVDAGSLSNSGAIIADDDGTGEPLSVHVSGDCDLDGIADPGTNGAMLDAFSGDLLVACDDGMTDSYGGLLTVAGGRLFSFGGTFLLGALGEIHLLGAVGDPAVLEAKSVSVRGGSLVKVTKDGLIDGETELDSGKIWMSTGARLDLLGDTSFSSAETSSTKQGTLRQVGDLSVKGESRISVDVYDWDGDGDAHTDVIGRYAIEANQIGDKGEYTGRVDVLDHLSVVVGGEKVASYWSIGKNGILNLHEKGTAPRVSGSAIAVRDGGTISGHGQIQTSVTTSGTVSPSFAGTFGTISFDNYTQTKGGILEIDVDGKGGGSDFVSVAGVAELGGTLLVRGDNLEVGDEFKILTAPTIKSSFTMLDLPKLEKGSWKVWIDSSGGFESVVLSVVP